MTWLIYGANGYTGRLIARLAVSRGERPVLAGRTADRIAPLAADLRLDYRIFDLADVDVAHKGIDGMDAVAHCAGPFSATARPMIEACLVAGVNYLDITGEIDVFEYALSRDAEAQRAGVALLPGAGFDVVPTDCLAAMLARTLPGAVRLDLAFMVGGGLSPGTARTVVEGMNFGGRARIDGEIRQVPAGWRRRTVPFPSGPGKVISIPWGDVSTAYHSTGIPNITTYTHVPAPGIVGRVQAAATPLMRLPGMRRLGKNLVGRAISGPDEWTRARTHSEVWGEVQDVTGRSASGTLICPNPYDLTADSVVRVARRMRMGTVAPGAHTPSMALGADYIRELDGVQVEEPMAC